MVYIRTVKCRICGSQDLTKYLDLGEVPLANDLKHSPDDEFATYPLEILFCNDCALSQLSVVVPPEILYDDYPYHSSVSQPFKDHCKQMAKDIRQHLYRPDGQPVMTPVVVDIASNDGCLLEQFQEEGYDTFGVEPSKNLVKEYAQKRLKLHGLSSGVVNDFWNEDSASRVPCCDVITATNVLAHTDKLYEFIILAKQKLRVYSKGIMVVEFPYFKNLLSMNQFDTIYHEHLSYFLLKPLTVLFDSCGMPIFKVEQHPVHGGSLRIYASPYKHEKHESVQEMLDTEEREGLYKKETYMNFTKKVELIKRDLVSLLTQLADQGKTVVGYGATAKASTLLEYCDIENDLIEMIVDETPDKQGMYYSGRTIPIVPFKEFEKIKPDYIILFAWNFAEELIKKTKHLGAKYIIPIPEVLIL